MKIDPHLPEILQTVSDNIITAVVAAPGTGKSIGIPYIVASTGSRIFISVPTVTAARSLYSYQKYLHPEIRVGYAAEGTVAYDDRSQIVYVTAGHLRRKMIAYFNRTDDGAVEISPIDFCDVLMIDEVHSGMLDNSVNIDLWKFAAKNGVSVPRLILSSATLDTGATGPLAMFPASEFPAPAVYQIDIKAFPIETRYARRDYDPDDNELYTDMAKWIEEVHNSKAPGDILVFAPGKNEVEDIIRDLTSKSLRNVILVPAYAALSSEDINRIYQPTPRGMRKIIVATNIAEAAITIDDIAFVFDSMTEKQAETSMSGGLRLVLSHISQSSADQRRGRTGRTRPGVAIRMITEEGFSKLQSQRVPEIKRVPIYTVIMELLKAGLRPVDVLSEIEPTRVGHAVKFLSRLGLINPATEEPTQGGDFVTHFPLGIRNATALWKWSQTGLPMFPAIATLAMIDCYGPSYMYYPRANIGEPPINNEEHRQKYFEQFRGRSDVDTLVNIWNKMMEDLEGPDARANDVLRWCRKNSMNHKKIREVLQIVRQCMSACGSLETQPREGLEPKTLNCEAGPFTREGLMNNIRPILTDVYSDMVMALSPRFAGKGKPIYIHGGIQGALETPFKAEDYILDRMALNTLALDPPPFIIAIISAEIQTKARPLHTVSVALDLSGPPPGYPVARKTLPRLEQIVPTAQRRTPLTEDQQKRLAEAAALAKERKRT